MLFRSASFVVVCGLGVAAVVACVGDSPSGESSSSSSGGEQPTLDASTGGSSGAGASGGSSGVSSSGGPGPSGATCNLALPFSTVTLLPGLSTGDAEYDVWVSADELTAYVSTSTSGQRQLLKAVRNSREVNFPAASQTPELAAVNEVGGYSVWSPSLTADLLALYTQSNGPSAGIHVAFRATTDAPFAASVPVRGRGDELGDKVGDAFIAASGATLFLATGPNSSELSITERLRDTGGIYGDGGLEDFGTQRTHESVSPAAGTDTRERPVSDAEGLIVVFGSNRAPATSVDLFEVRRAGLAGEFAAAVRLPEPVNSAGSDRAGSISGDGCSLYFTSDRAGGAGGFDVYVARRAQ